MAEAALGARVQFCNHNGWFVADIFKIGNCNVIRANGKVTTDNIKRSELDTMTHQMRDFPVAGFWSRDKGIFVVPEKQVIDLRKNDTK